jgi:acetylornithine deacetylase
VLVDEVAAVLDALKRADDEFSAEAYLRTSRPPHVLDGNHPLVKAAQDALERCGRSSTPIGMSFWTDAAVLAASGTPSILLGPGGAGLHSLEEYVNVDDVYTCRDLLIDIAQTLVTSSGR